MLTHHLKIAYRNIKSQKSSFLINLIGLTAGLTCTLLIFLWVMDEFNKDSQFSQSDQLFELMEHQQYSGNIMTTWSTPGLLAETIKEELPEVEYAATGTWITDYTLSYEKKNLKVKGYYVGPDYFNIFSFPLLYGEKAQVLKDKKSIVISETLAKSFFGTTENVIGKTIQIQHDKLYQVSGIFADLPSFSTIQHDFVLSFEAYKDEFEWVNSWGNNGPKTFVLLKKGTNVTAFNNKIANYVKEKNEESNVTLFAYPYSKLYLYGKFENGIQTGGKIEYVRIFILIAIFVLAIACINFMNLSTARAGKRAKEVGIKKAVGANRGSLISQFLIESVIISMVSLMLSYLLVYLILPGFNELTQKHINFDFSIQFLAISLGISLLTGILAGSYPAFYLSSFQTLSIIKGIVKGTGSELIARKGLVVFQFFLSLILIVSVMVIYDQINFVQSKNLGFEKDQIVNFAMEGQVESKTETFLAEVSEIKGVEMASSIGHSLLNRQNNTSGLTWEGKEEEQQILFENIRVNYDIFELLQMEIASGRFFSRDFGRDSVKIIFNETAISLMGLENPIGQTVRLWDQYDLEIIGVVKDFHFQSLHEKIAPAFFILDPKNTWNFMVRITAGEEKETLARLQSLYSEFNPGFIFDYEFLDQEYAANYDSEDRIATILKYFAGFAILISCLGLFGLAAYMAEQRTKEIGIRKALGSTRNQIIILITKEFTLLVITSVIIALPVSYYLAEWWLSDYAYRIDIKLTYFIVAGILSILISWLTVGIQAYLAARTNPATCLKYE